VQIPDSPLGDVQASKLANGLLKLGLKEIGNLLGGLGKGLHVFAKGNLLLKMPRSKRFSTWVFSSSTSPTFDN
jgi:hypothetical protein